MQNLFYLNNIVYDRLYDVGFTEAERNFQENNFGRGGVGSDAAQDCRIWTAFAQFGIGEGSSGVVSGSTVTITPSFAVPTACQ